MTSGKEHESSTKWWGLLFALTIGIAIDLQSGVMSGLGFLIGGIWLSPDLDTNSIAVKKWGVLRVIWRPYQKLIPHRSIFSHGPFIGTLVRLIYLIGILYYLICVFKVLGIIDSFNAIDFVKMQFTHKTKEIISIVIGIEASAWLHIIQDGDPLPAEWHKFRRR